MARRGWTWLARCVCVWSAAGSGWLLSPAWANFQGGPHHNGYSPLDGPPNVARVVWAATAAGLNVQPNSAVAIGAGNVFAYGCGGGAAYIVCFDKRDGTHRWTSPPLDPTPSCSFASWASPVYDATTAAVYIASGSQLYCLNAQDGDIRYQRTLPAPTVNASPLVADELIAVHTYGGFSPATSWLDVYAIDGSPLWRVQHGGGGTAAPVWAENTLFDLVSTGAGASQMRAYHPRDGAIRWTSQLELAYRFFGGVSYHEGALYALTYNFNGNGELVCVSADSGAHRWVRSAPSGDCTPVVGAGRVIVVGHPSAARVTAFSTSGDLLWQRVVGGAHGWAVSAAQAGRYVYVAAGRLVVLDAASGDIVSQATPTAIAGTPVVDGETVLVPGQGGVFCFAAERHTEVWGLY